MRTVALALLFVACFSSPVTAAESGHFRGLAVLANTNFQIIKAGDGHPGQAVMIGEMDGVIFNDRKEPFLHNAHYRVIWKGDGRGNSDCFKTFTMPDGDKVYGVCYGTSVADGYVGKVELVGGTGKYQGIKGQGQYKVTTSTERMMWDLIEWDYQIP